MKSRRDVWILDTLAKKGKILVKEISDQYDISLESARRDLRRLAKDGLLIRTHGGAMSKDRSDAGDSFKRRQKLNLLEKKYIAQKAVQHVFEDAIIGLDASSTSWCFAQELPDIPCKVVTNSMHNVEILAEKKNIEIIATGGVFSEKYLGFYGPLAELLLNRLHIDIGIFSCIGIDNEGNTWESNELNTSIKKKLMSVCDKKYLLADTSKFGKSNLIQLASLTEFDEVFVEKSPQTEILDYIHEHNIKLNA